jgi:hypothetical protein
MEVKRARKTALFLLIALAGIAGFTYLATIFIRGYRPRVRQHGLGILPTGLLVAQSNPKSASVYIDNKLATATDDTLNLTPGEYDIKIEKDGYLPWQKTVEVKKEIVTPADATLFKTTPNLKPLTNTGAMNPTLSPDGTKIVYVVQDASKEKNNGIWLLDLYTNLPINRSNTKQLTEPVENFNYENSEFIWGPDGKNVLLVQKADLEENTNQEKQTQNNQSFQDAYQIPTDRFTNTDQLNNVSFRLELILNEWGQEEKELLEEKLKDLPKELIPIATQSATNIKFSGDNEKMFYLATQSATIPENLIPHPPSRSSQPETRDLKADHWYVYDLKQDINFELGSIENMPQPVKWLTNHYLVFINKENQEIKAIEWDATNLKTIYSGPFENGFVFPSPNGKSLITLTSLHPDSPGNLYEVQVR